MNYINQITPDPELVDLEKEQKSLRNCFSRCGWSVFVLTATSFVLSLLLGMLFGLLIEWGVPGISMDLINNHLLVFNEILIGLSILSGALVLLGLPKAAPMRRPITAKGFLTGLCICMGISWVGSLISTVWLTISALLTQQSTSNPVAQIVTTSGPWQLILCTGILAPVLEEFFFRKLLIDRMHRHGELASILTSALLFGLFHQNFSQFFYAFGVGVVLSYLYCKTGSYRLVTLLHMALNLIGGVIPGLLYSGFSSFIETLSTITFHEETLVKEILSLLVTRGIPFLLFFPFMLLQSALNITGLILLFVSIKKIKIQKSPSPLPAAAQRNAIMQNTGMIAATVLLVTMMILSLFKG